MIAVKINIPSFQNRKSFNTKFKWVLKLKFPNYRFLAKILPLWNNWTLGCLVTATSWRQKSVTQVMLQQAPGKWRRSATFGRAPNLYPKTLKLTLHVRTTCSAWVCWQINKKKHFQQEPNLPLDILTFHIRCFANLQCMFPNISNLMNTPIYSPQQSWMCNSSSKSAGSLTTNKLVLLWPSRDLPL